MTPALHIAHTDARGTLLTGTTKADGTAEVLKPIGWRWGRTLNAWYLPRSRNTPPQRGTISRTETALLAAGHDVAVAIDTTPQDRRDVETRRGAASTARAARLTARADREQQRADRRWEAADTISRSIPTGQPILTGHHSQPRAERDHDRIQGHREAATAHTAHAQQARHGAHTAASATAARNHPATVAERIERLTAQLRRDQRQLDRSRACSPDADTAAIADRIRHTTADLTHWQAVRAAQLGDGTATDYGPHTVEPGDLVKINGTWHTVTRANPKTVTVTTNRGGTGRAPWHRLQGHQRPDPGAHDQ